MAPRTYRPEALNTSKGLFVLACLLAVVAMAPIA